MGLHKAKTDVVIVGGGLAGLCSAIDLAGKGISVVLIEKHEYPGHKVCGEYVSNETLPYLFELGIDPFEHGAVRIDELDFGTQDGETIRTKLPLGGFGISRFKLDHLLMKKALENGAVLIRGTVVEVNFEDNMFSVKTKEGESFESMFVIGAQGKRSQLDKRLGRSFINNRSSYVAVKAHYKGDFPENLVGLYNFEGGYCGVSNVENRQLNICYIAEYGVFQRYKSVDLFHKEVLLKNKQLKAILTDAEMLFDKPLSISQISFDSKELLVDHVLMCGDSAGLIHPLCGNGMGMAIGGAQLVSEAILSYFNGHLSSRQEVEKLYVRSWNRNFKSRLRTGHALAALLRNYRVSFVLLPLLRSFPFVLRQVIQTTHGKAALAV